MIKFESRDAIKDSYDVIVVGSGPAGMGAAIRAGRMGVRILVIESQGCVGGLSTTGMMSHFTGRVESKLYSEILDRAAQKNFYPNRIGREVIDPEILKITYLEMLEECNVDLLLYTTLSDVVMDGNRVVGIETFNKNGRSLYLTKVVIDCTGDGDAAYKSGAEFFKGRETDGKMQPATLMFKVGGVDESGAVFPCSFETLVETDKGELQALAKKILPYPAGHVLLYKSTLPGIVTVNMTNAIDIDGTTVEDLTKAELTCRKQMLPIVKFLREYAPGYENCYIIGAASLIGIRETRHFKGKKTMNEKDILNATQFDDAVVYGAHFNFDIHNISGAGLDKNGVQKHFSQKNGYTIPYGCMVPEKIEGLLLSGRNISGTHLAHSNFRAMPICLAIGEADGIAAALAVKNDVLPSQIQAEAIRVYL